MLNEDQKARLDKYRREGTKDANEANDFKQLEARDSHVAGQPVEPVNEGDGQTGEELPHVDQPAEEVQTPDEQNNSTEETTDESVEVEPETVADQVAADEAVEQAAEANEESEEQSEETSEEESQEEGVEPEAQAEESTQEETKEEVQG
jgi:hypothetical protein